MSLASNDPYQICQLAVAKKGQECRNKIEAARTAWGAGTVGDDHVCDVVESCMQIYEDELNKLRSMFDSISLEDDSFDVKAPIMEKHEMDFDEFMNMAGDILSGIQK